MSDIAPAAPPAAPPAEPAAAPSGAPPADAPTPPADAGGAPTPPWEGKTPEELGKRISELTTENTKYKERWRPWEDTFGGLHEQDQQFFFGFIQALRSGDKAAIAEFAAPMRTLLDEMSPADQAKAAAAIEKAAGQNGQDPEFDPYNPENIDKRVSTMLEQRFAQERQARDQQDATAAALRGIEDHTKAIAERTGIAKFGDPRTDLGRLLLLKAHNDFPDEPTLNDRLDRAAEAIQEELAQQAQELLKAKSAGAGPSPVPAGAAEPSGVKKPSSMTDAKAAGRERLDKLLGGQVPG